MGRGRSKAKQTRVARDLKYSSQDIDIERLAKELHGEVQEVYESESNPKSKDQFHDGVWGWCTFSILPKNSKQPDNTPAALWKNSRFAASGR